MSTCTALVPVATFPRVATPRPWKIGKSYGAVVADKSLRGDHGWYDLADPTTLDLRSSPLNDADCYGHAIGGTMVAESIRRPNAELIVRAVNAHDELCGLLGELIDWHHAVGRGVAAQSEGIRYAFDILLDAKNLLGRIELERRQMEATR